MNDKRLERIERISNEIKNNVDQYGINSGAILWFILFIIEELKEYIPYFILGSVVITAILSSKVESSYTLGITICCGIVILIFRFMSSQDVQNIDSKDFWEN